MYERLEVEINNRAMNAHSLDKYRVSLRSLGREYSENPPKEVFENFSLIAVVSPKIELVIGSKKYDEDEVHLQSIRLEVRGKFVAPPLQDGSKLIGAPCNFSDFKINSYGVNRFDMSTTFDQQMIDQTQHSMTLKLETAWGSAKIEILNKDLGSDRLLNQREVIYGDLGTRLFITAFVNSILTERNPNDAPLKSALVSLDGVVSSICKGAEVSSFTNCFSTVREIENKDAHAENQDDAIKSAKEASDIVCRILSSGMYLKPIRTIHQNMFLGLGISVLLGGIIAVGVLTAGAAYIPLSIVGGSALPVFVSEIVTFVMNRGREMRENYREILRLIAENLGCEEKSTGSNDEYRLEQLIKDKVDSLQGRHDRDSAIPLENAPRGSSPPWRRLFTLGILSPKEAKPKAPAGLDPAALFSEPLESAVVRFKDMNQESQILAAIRLQLVLKTHQLRKALQGSIFISIMGPHNVGKSHLLNALFGDTLSSSGTHMAERTGALAAHKLCENLQVLDTPGTTDPTEISRNLAQNGLHAGIVILMFRARDVSEPALHLLQQVNEGKGHGVISRIYITHMDTEQNLNKPGMKQHQKDYEERLECSKEDFELVSFQNNAGDEGSSCPRRVEMLRALGVLSASDVVCDILNLMKKSGYLDSEGIQIVETCLTKRITALKAKGL